MQPYISNNKLLFIVGVWRSGTSLLHTMLNQHPQIALMYEVEPFALWPLDGNTIWPDDWPQRLNLYNCSITRHQFDSEPLPVQVTGREALLTLFRIFAERRGAKIMGGKSPSYHGCLPEIAKIFPEASIVVVWRDPVEYCRSAVRAAASTRFFAMRGRLMRMLFGAEQLARGVERLKRGGTPVHEMVYDDLVHRTEGELRKICEFLEIGFDGRMLDLKNADLSLLPDGEPHDQVRSGVIKKRTIGEELLPPKFMAKARGYAGLWRQRYAHLKFAQALQPGNVSAPPPPVEQVLDRIAYTFWRTYDESKHQVQRHVPLSWWRLFRTCRASIRAKPLLWSHKVQSWTPERKLPH